MILFAKNAPQLGSIILPPQRTMDPPRSKTSFLRQIIIIYKEYLLIH
jgi:hypothetical protein